MTNTARTRNVPTTVMLPQYQLPNGQFTDVPAYHTSRDVHDFVCHQSPRHYGRGNDGWTYLKLRDPQTTAAAPKGAKTVVVLEDGIMPYASTGFKAIPGKPWWNHMMRQPRQAFVVWGDRHGKVFNTESSRVRSGGARGVIFSRYPVFSEFNGSITDIRVKVLLVEFQLLTRQPERGESLRYKVDTVHFRSDDEISLYGRDDAWGKLLQAAKNGFDRNCAPKESARELSNWASWFFDQKAKASAGYDDFRYTCSGLGWLVALDSVTEAWQLPIALGAYSSMFPEVPPFDAVFDASDERKPEEIALHPGERRLLNEGRRDELLELLATKGSGFPTLSERHFIMPRYEGSRGSMEGALMAAYLRLRPQRREQFEQWMTDYVGMTDGFRNYTGD